MPANEELQCSFCKGTGFNSAVVDLDRWMDAAAAFRNEVRPAFNYKDDDGNLIGLRSCIIYNRGVPTISRTLLAKDFLLKGDSEADD